MDKEIRYTFKGSAGKEVNDVIYSGPPFRLDGKSSYIFRLTPKTKYWRFGVRLSQTESILFDSDARYKNQEFKDIQVVVGDMSPDKTWSKPDKVELGNYHYIPGYNVNPIDVCNHYEELSPIELKVQFDSTKNHFFVSYDAGGCNNVGKRYDLIGYTHFQIFAWADWIDFELDCDIKIIPFEDEHDFRNIQYWVLKLHPGKWDFKDFGVGTEVYFGTHSNFKKREEYNLYFDARPNDKVIGYAFESVNKIIWLLEVTRSVFSHETLGECISLVITKILDPAITLIPARSPITLHNLGGNSHIRLISITKKAFNKLLSLKGEETKIEGYYPFYLSEGNHKNTDDKLRFKYDIESMASVISLRDVKPPLAIGLFGNWGSGKSFFMEKLQEKIEAYAESRNEKYVRHVVSVRFNSWHYYDANLWASLITHIFESLNDYAQKNKFGADKVDSIWKQLNFAEFQVVEVKKKVESNANEIKDLEDEVGAVRKIIEQKNERLTLWSTGNLVKIVFSDPMIIADFEGIKRQFHNEQLISDLNEVDGLVAEVSGFLNKTITVIRLKSKYGKNHRNQFD